jgi:hypothetical protein
MQDYMHELAKPECQKAVKATMERASEDIRFASKVADECYEDRQTLCKNVPPVRSEVVHFMSYWWRFLRS